MCLYFKFNLPKKTTHKNHVFKGLVALVLLSLHRLYLGVFKLLLAAHRDFPVYIQNLGFYLAGILIVYFVSQETRLVKLTIRRNSDSC